MYSGQWETEIMETESQLLRKHPGHLLRRGYQKGLAIILEKLSNEEITPLQLTVLMALDESGPCTQRALSNLIAMEPSNVHPMLRRMRDMELVVIEVSESDKRRSHIIMTPKGNDLLQHLMPLQVAAGKELLERLNEEEQEEFIRLLEKVTCTKDL